MITWLNELAKQGVFFKIKNGQLKIFTKKEGLEKKLLDEIKVKKEEIKKYLENQNDLVEDQDQFTNIPSLSYQENYPLSDAQRRMWVLTQLEDDSVTYNIPSQMTLQEYDIESFKKAIYAVIERHEILRTIFKENSDGEIRQWILDVKEIDFAIKEYDFRDNKEPEKKIKEYIQEDVTKPFDLINGPLLRVILFKVSDSDYVFYFNIHHIISDGWSMKVLTEDLLSYYNAYKKEEAPVLADLKIQYKDYSSWQLNKLKEGDYEKSKEFWLKEFSTEIPKLDLPSTKVRPKLKTSNGSKLVTYIDPETVNQLKKWTKESKGSLFAGLVTIISVLLHKYTRQNDFIIGTPVSGRDHENLDNQIGLYTNTIAIKTELDQDESLIQYFEKVKNSIQNALSHQFYPFDVLLDQLKLTRDPSRSALFDIIVDLHNTGEIKTSNFIPSSFNTIDFIDNVMSKVDLEIIFEEIGDYLSFSIGYNNDVYERELIERFVRHFKRVLARYTQEPQDKIKNIDYLYPDERIQLLEEFNETKTKKERINQVLDAFKEQCAKTPEGTALIYEEEKLSYEKLDNQSDQLAEYLISKKLEGEFIPICIDRSFSMIIAILGILKSGNAFVPIDPKLPKQRIDYILRDVKSSEVICDEKYVKLFANRTVLNIDVFDFNNYSSKELIIDINEDKPAYCIYTSGTTGQSKGVVISHKSLSNYIQYAAKTYTNNESLKFTLVTSISFDLTITSIFTPLITGGVIEIIATQENYLEELKLVSESSLEIIKLTPSHLSVLLDFVENNKQELIDHNSKVFILGGEELPYTLVKRLFSLYGKTTTLWNEYGPTETTVGCISKKITVEDDEEILIGKPTTNVQVYILDNDELLPIGVTGEICIGGPQLALGYLNKKDETHAKFVPNPFKRDEKVYKTGDLGCWLSNGDIQYLGRIDDQVKIRGYRVGLIEVKEVLEAHNLVTEAAIVVDEENAKKRLLGYFVGKERVELSELQSYLQEQLPNYMVPSKIIQIEAIPLTSNGKVDHSILLSSIPSSIDFDTEYIAPRDQIEGELVQIWSKLLSINPKNIGIDIGFFQLGGNSLHIMELHLEIKKIFGKDVSVASLFQNTSIRLQSQLLSGKGENLKTTEKELDKLNTPRTILEEEKGSSDIAVIGMAMKAPGADNVHQFWDNLKKGVEPLKHFSEEELISFGISEDVLNDKNYIRSSFFLNDKEYFDSSFFGYLPDEAKMMDPQTRIFHELVWSALEDAGYDPLTYPGLIGLYAGSRANLNWKLFSLLTNDDSNVDWFTAAQLQDKDFLNSLVAYRLNLKGGVYTINTACSTSLVAVNQAVKSLLSGENHIALAGGIALKSADQKGYFYSEGMVSSNDGHTRTFDVLSNGTVESEGAGLVVLKKLSEAKKDGDNILAVIKGSAINNDGNRKVGFTAPSIDGQVDVIQMAQRFSGVSPNTISYIEAHGTATKLGDVIEFEALRQVFGTGASKYCALGTVKSNMGHLDTAAGITGFIKTVLCLKNKQLVPSLHFTSPNPELNYETSPFYVNTELKNWKSPYKGPCRAGVSSFGIGGTNAHVVLEEYIKEEEANKNDKPQLIILSAKTPQALEQQKKNLKKFIERTPSIDIKKLAWTLQAGRSEFLHRTSFIANNLGVLIDKIDSEDLEIDTRGENKKIVFMFPGQGAQYLNMGRDLYNTEKVFKTTIDYCFKLAASINGVDYKELLFSSEESDLINETQNTQPLLFIFEYSLAKQLDALGVKPDMMIGHSIGEYVAACISGVITLKDAIRLVIARGEMIQKLPKGTMMSVGLTEDEVQLFLNDQISIAAVNSDKSCILSGSTQAILAIQEQLDDMEVVYQELKTSHAFHSEMMAPIKEEFLKVFSEVNIESPKIPYISNVTGKKIKKDQVMHGDYWFNHIRKTVRFLDGLESIFRTNKDLIFIEIGPGKTLSNFARQCNSYTKNCRVENLVRHPKEIVNDTEYLLTSIGKLWRYGVSIDWQNLHSNAALSKISLPTYPFEKIKYPIGENLNTTLEEKLKFGTKHKKGDSSKWFYTPSWKQENILVHSKDQNNDQCYLVFKNSLNHCEKLIKKLKTTNKVIEVGEGDTFIKKNDFTYLIDPRNYKDYELLFEDLNAQNIYPENIVHLYSLGITEYKKGIYKQLGFYSLLNIAKCLNRQEKKYPIKVITITNGIHKVLGNENLQCEKSLLMGVSLIMSQENPEINSKNIDIVLGEGDMALEDKLYNEVISNTLERNIAYRYNNRWVKYYRSVELKKQEKETSRVKSKGVYLITGGLGNLGYTYAKYFQEQYDASLIIIGRSSVMEIGQEGTKSTRLKSLEDKGKVLYYKVDISNEEEVRKKIEEGESIFGTINGVIHTAGIQGEMIRRGIHLLEPEKCEEHFQPKVNGTIVLKEIFKNRELDFCIFSSSIASIIGGKEFGTYAAANMFMDHISQEGIIKNSISINYDGLNFGNETDELSTTPEETISILERVLSYPQIPQLIVSVADLDYRINKWVYKVNQKSEINQNGDTAHKKDISRDKVSTVFIEPKTETEKELVHLFETFFGIKNIGINDDFFELGGDSLKAMTLSNSIHKRYDVALDLKDFFMNPNIKSLAKKVENRLSKKEKKQEISNTKYEEIL